MGRCGSIEGEIGSDTASTNQRYAGPEDLVAVKPPQQAAWQPRLNDCLPASGIGKVKYCEYRPHSILQDTVRCFWTHEATYSAESIQSITPDGCVELIFNFGSPYLLLTTKPPCILPRAVIVGFQKKTISISVNGTVKVVAARLFAWGALALFQEEISALTGAMTTLGTGWETLSQRLEDHVLQGRYEEASITLQDFLIQKALMRSYDLKLVQTAAKLLYHTRGQCRIEELADHCHASVRQLERRFQQATGVTPKFFARTLRFEQAQRQLMFHPETALTQLALQCGYFDQAHFIKEFRAFTGKTPSEYMDEMRQLQEMLQCKDVVFLQS
jgi:AraC-like DNA-binding protein